MAQTSPSTRYETAQLKAQTLMEALPWMQRYAGSIMVFKYGGNAMVDESLRAAFAADMVFLRAVGIRPVVVHGGGPQITAMLERLEIPSEFRGGLRYTTPEAMEVVRMVLTGQVARELVGLINAHGPHAVGMSGEDGGLLRARRITTVVDGQETDLGLVGEVVGVNTTAILSMIEAGKIPVISSIAPEIMGERALDRGLPQDTLTGEVLNVNADTAASALAVALGAHKLVVLTDVEGVYANWPDESSLLSKLPVDEAERMLATVDSGMVPKLEACIRAVRGGVPHTHVVNGRRPHSILLEIFTDEGIGTMITSGGRR